MSEVTPKRGGFCSVCDEPIIGVRQKWTDGQRKGEPRVFTEMLPGAKRTHIALLDGTHTALSLCASCHLTPENLTFVWKRVLMATRLEASPEWRRAREMKKYTQAQYEGALKNLHRFMQNMPVGVICTQTYAEMNDG